MEYAKMAHGEPASPPIAWLPTQCYEHRTSATVPDPPISPHLGKSFQYLILQIGRALCEELSRKGATVLVADARATCDTARVHVGIVGQVNQFRHVAVLAEELREGNGLPGVAASNR